MATPPGGLPKWDPNEFKKLRGTLKQERQQRDEQAARVAARTPKAKPQNPAKDKMSTPKNFGLRSRRDMANVLSIGKGDPNGLVKKGKDPYIKGAGPTKFNAQDVAGGDPNGKKPKSKAKGKGDANGMKGKKNCY